MSNHTDLNVLLDGIEVRANFRGTHAECEAVFPRVIADNKVLVKALRRAMDALPNDGIRRDAWWYHSEAEDAVQDVTAILQASSEPKGEKEN